MLPAFVEYCRLIAGLADQFPTIRYSTLTVFSIGPFAAEVEGQLAFESDYVLDVWELIDLSTGAIRNYSTNWIAPENASGGTIPPNIRVTQPCATRTRTTNTFRPTSSITAFRRLASVSHPQTCLS